MVSSSFEPFKQLPEVCQAPEVRNGTAQGAKVVKEIYNAPDGQHAQHEQLGHTLDDMKEVWEQLEHDNNQGSILHDGVHFQEAARKSQEAANALRVILDECKSKKPGSLRHAAAAFVRSLAKGSQIEQQLLMLGQCREALKLHIITSTHHEVGGLVKSLKRVDSGQQKILGNLQALLDKLSDNDGPNLSSHLGKIKKISNQAVARFNAHRIMQSLDVSHTRYDEVIDASPHTYRWIYNDRPGEIKANTPRLSDEAVQARTDLQTWLQAGSGVFHIAGKPGSGKSTLMKFLVKSDGTEKLLKKWAPSEELVVLEFFFWKPGSPSQNTLRGLKRSIVAQILKNVPELSEHLFPDCYQAELGLDLLEKPIVDSSDVQLAFERLLGPQSISKLRQYKICLFLDGLDEFNESAERINHASLVSQIMEWVDASDGHVKAVLSSRQLPAFENITAVCRIRLQDITRNDIINYVEGTLDVNTNFKRLQAQDSQGCQRMIQELADRADGVFLWVSLVLQSIEDGLGNLDPLPKLRTRIKKTPQELGDLFDQILLKIDHGPYRKEVYLLLAIASTETWAGQPPREVAPEGRDNDYPFISLLAAGCLFDEMDSGLTIESITRRAIEGYPNEKFDDSALITSRTRLSGRCLGLLEVIEHENGQFVKFLHRSIPEHLENHISKQLRELHIYEVDILNVMACMIAMELRFSRFVTGFDYVGLPELTLQIASNTSLFSQNGIGNTFHPIGSRLRVTLGT
ncbi:hypothetical protein G7054_g5179 [Neopestalotiopsis clavispora]|nr:hypothetical protein G7054_g5179 [Neopestalotiopsis clavispora]